jgi:hypothetical protein
MTSQMRAREVTALHVSYVSFRRAHGPRMANNTLPAWSNRAVSNARIVASVGAHRTLSWHLQRTETTNRP